MPILPIAEFEADLAEQDRQTYERLKPPSSVVAKFGVMGLIGEFPYGLEEKPGCGTKFVLRTHRGTEIGEMLTSTCPNSGCSKSISRKEMLEYIDRSGGKDYPFFSMQGKVLRIATVEDLNQQARIEATRPQMTRHAKALVERMGLPMKLVDAEPILGGEKVTFYFLSEERIDFRELVAALAAEHSTRIEMRQVGSRDEARLTADYEKCGQHCCCKQFLKVLKPVSMKNAKIQKATLDPIKISGRCGRLMCCLRYEEATYDDLRARLPKKRTRVRGEFGTGIVVDTQILTQLCLVLIDNSDERVAVALEELTILGPGDVPAPNQPTRRNAEVVGGAEGAEDVEAESGEEAMETGEAPSAPAVQPPQPAPRSEPRPAQQRPPQQQRPQWGGQGGPRPDRRDGPPRGEGQRPAQFQQQPQQRPPQRPPQQQPPSRPPQEPQDEIDELLGEMETDMGDGGPRGPGARTDGGGGGGGGGGGRKRRRKRRRGGGGGGGPPGGGGAGGPPA